MYIRSWTNWIYLPSVFMKLVYMKLPSVLYSVPIFSPYLKKKVIYSIKFIVWNKIPSKLFYHHTVHVQYQQAPIIWEFKATTVKGINSLLPVQDVCVFCTALVSHVHIYIHVHVPASSSLSMYVYVCTWILQFTASVGVFAITQAFTAQFQPKWEILISQECRCELTPKPGVIKYSYVWLLQHSRFIYVCIYLVHVCIY